MFNSSATNTNVASTFALKLAFVIISLTLLNGCEDDKGSSNFDFGTNDPNLVVCVGDSITEGGYPTQLASITTRTVASLSAGGVKTGEGIGMIKSALAQHKPGYVLFMFGANDIIMGDDLDLAAEHIRVMIQIAKNNKTIPVVATLTPMLGLNSKYEGGAQYLSKRIRVIASEEGARVADAYSAIGNNPDYMRADGLHPNAEGNMRIAKAFRSKIN